ncbi:hypothetical protein V1477_017201 [Vespula maculifrons]|uniref:Uncharacterized protein n=2 Tax=Vespula TaxID=7451 RepID=A0A834NC68_VESGE|nr:hypothetical protein HZH68_006404 [Vespula germanica]
MKAGSDRRRMHQGINFRLSLIATLARSRDREGQREEERINKLNETKLLVSLIDLTVHKTITLVPSGVHHRTISRIDFAYELL